MARYNSIGEWRAEGERRFGKDVKNWKFRCPMCGHIASVQDFINAGAKDPANCAYVECLGRYIGKGAPRGRKDGQGCNWAAYGLFGIPNEDHDVVVNAQGESIDVYSFAEVE